MVLSSFLPLIVFFHQSSIIDPPLYWYFPNSLPPLMILSDVRSTIFVMISNLTNPSLAMMISLSPRLARRNFNLRRFHDIFIVTIYHHCDFHFPYLDNVLTMSCPHSLPLFLNFSLLSLYISLISSPSLFPSILPYIFPSPSLSSPQAATNYSNSNHIKL